ncbi:hypothetical protein [Infirmifilum sp.]|uniref:hypothetical protein n=1 Tax=Infirmifilum sp. TaxID=2856575 RepID=UPI003D0DD191
MSTVILISLLTKRKVILRGLIDGIKLGLKLRKKYPKFDELKKQKHREPRINILWRFSSIPLIVRAFIRFGKKTSHALYLLVSRYYTLEQNMFWNRGLG